MLHCRVMLQVDKLTKNYGDRLLFDDLSFFLQPKERCGLAGRNGSGKTTLFRIICGQESSDEGTVLLPKDYRIGQLEQHASFQEAELLAEAARGLPPGEEEHLYKAEKILFGLGFTEEDLKRACHSFSSGYQLRLRLAKTLIAQPDLLLLDEPTNFLDVVSIRWLERFLRRWKGELLLVSHDRNFMDSVCTHVMGLHRQKALKVKGNTEAYYQRIVQQEEAYERTRINREKKRAHAESFIERFGAKATKAKQAQSRAKALEKMPSLERLAEIDHLSFHFPSAAFPGRLMLQANSLSFVYPEMRHPPPGGWVIHKLSIELEKGERLAVIGKNGQGKSTILRLLFGELKANQGDVQWKQNLKMGYFGQTAIDRLDLELSIEESIASANPLLNNGEVRSICGLMMFSGDDAKKPIRILSGGERSRVLLGCLLAQPCNLLLLDEPTNHLDMESIEALIQALDEFDGSVILVTHDEALLKRFPKRLIICHPGKQQTFLGNYEDFLLQQGWEEEQGDKLTQKKNSSEKSRKRQRAEWVQERARVLAPLKKKLQSTEKRVEALEQDIETLNKKLIEASQTQNSSRVQELSIELATTREALEQEYAQWEELGERITKEELHFSSELSHSD